jgi:hypothetical protein
MQSPSLELLSTYHPGQCALRNNRSNNTTIELALVSTSNPSLKCSLGLANTPYAKGDSFFRFKVHVDGVI